MRGPLLFAAVAAVCVAVTASYAEDRVFVWQKPDWLPPPAVPSGSKMTVERVTLGRHLFYDARLSADGTIACASCHEQSRAFSDGRATSIGIGGQRSFLNAPSLGNVAYMSTLTWANPMVETLEFHALIPLFGSDPEEMGNAGREDELFQRIMADPYYQEAFPSAFPDTPEANLYTVTRALAAFQRTLITADSPYDRYKYGGDRSALSVEALRGEALFFDHRLECYHCHAGFNFTNNLVTSRSAFAQTSFHNTGLGVTGGLAEFTLSSRDEGRFRTPSLRNVELTAPYMHDGRFDTLEEVIRHYSAGGEAARQGNYDPNRDPLVPGFTISDSEVSDLIAFLESLTDESFISNLAFADPWPEGHPARAKRIMPETLDHPSQIRKETQ